ncbi:hypothetical protein FHG87_025029 [Trinorchestia longiramus]|nr:hypothetical protein FHG87_025029 [Trinorchestia longiramus]
MKAAVLQALQRASGYNVRMCSASKILQCQGPMGVQAAHLQDLAAQNQTPTKTVRDMVEKFTSMVGASATYKAATVDRTKLLKLLPKSQDDLPTRTMSDSWDCAVIPLSTNERLREKYVTFNEGVRIGRLLEDLDVFSGAFYAGNYPQL